MNDDEIFEKIKSTLSKAFEIEATRITPETHLFDDLDLDSIDAVDLAIKIQGLTGKRIKPEDFKNVRTVDDVVSTVRQLLAA